MIMGPKLIQSSSQKIGKKTIDVAVWRHPKGWTQEEVDICTKYYQLQAKKFGMSIEHYMREFQWN